MRNIKLTIQYDGTNYNGWQIQKSNIDQKNIITIQGLLQEAIKKITGEDVKLIGAGRTDAGVHAIEQVAAFKTNSKIHADIIKRALNANIPADIRIIDACDSGINFHPRYDAKSKVYLYIISNSYVISPFLYRYVWKIPQKLNLQDMKGSIEFFKGTHDFSSFRASGCGAKNSIRTITDISIDKSDYISFLDLRIDGNFIKIQIEANAFLRHMVRNMVGTIVEVGKGKLEPLKIHDILSSKNRGLAGPTAPANGLFLKKIRY